MAANETEVTIDRDGVHITVINKLGGEDHRHYDWNQIPEVAVHNISEIEANRNEDPPLPIDIEASGLTIQGEEPPDQQELDSYDFWRSLEQETGIKYDLESEEVVFNENASDKQNYVSFVEFLVNSGYVTAQDMPYQTRRAQTNYVLNTEPRHADGDEMQRPAQIAENIWLETNAPKDQKKAKMKTLYERFVE